MRWPKKEVEYIKQWFAWYPIKLESGETVWLEKVWYRTIEGGFAVYANTKQELEF